MCGRYCCETSLPKYLSEYNATFEDVAAIYTNSGRSRSSTDNQCNYAFIAKESLLDEPYYDLESSTYDSVISELKDLKYVEAVLDWEILNSTLQLPYPSHCSDSNITSSQKNHSSGRTCQCSDGFYGNPYILGGCTGLWLRITNF